MLVVISPAKKLDWAERTEATTAPQFGAEANALAAEARKLSAADLEKLMKISPKLAQLNADRFAAFADAPGADAVRPAALAFAGDTYAGLEAGSLEPDALDYAQGHLRILSGLYGVLRPLDAMQAYRLEMGSKLATERGRTLYDWWGTRPADALNAQAEETGARVLVNCASVEYFGAVDRAALVPEVVTPVFVEEQPDGGEKIVSFHAKKARGAMARFIVENRLDTVEGLKDLDAGGYRFRREEEGARLVFGRG